MRRVLTLFLILCLWAPWTAARAETFVVNVGGGDEQEYSALLLRDDGTALTPLGEYAEITPLTPAGTAEADRRYAVQPASLAVDLEGRDSDTLSYWEFYRVALMDGGGNLLTGFDYCGLKGMVNGSITFEVPVSGGVLSGVMDRDGHVLIPPKYSSISYLGEDRWLALLREGSDDRYDVVLVDAEGTEYPTGLHTDSSFLPEQLSSPCPIDNVEETGGRTVYLAPSGKLAFYRSYERARFFNGSLAPVEEEGKYGLIDREGRFAAPAIYDYIYSVDEPGQTVLAAEKGSTLFLFDNTTGEELLQRDFAPADYISANLSIPGMLWVSAGDTLYALSPDGTELGAFQGGENLSYQAVSCNPDAIRVLEIAGESPDDRVRLLDSQGKPLSATYENIYEQLWRDGSGRYVCARQPVVGSSPESSGWQRWRYGVIDENGRELLPPVYLDGIQALSPDRYWVKTPERSGMIDSAGKWYYTIENYDYLMD